MLGVSPAPFFRPTPKQQETYPELAEDLPRRYSERKMATVRLGQTRSQTRSQKGHLSPVRGLRDKEGPVAPAEDKYLKTNEMSEYAQKLSSTAIGYSLEDPSHPRLIEGGAQNCPGNYGKETRLRVGPRGYTQ